MPVRTYCKQVTLSADGTLIGIGIYVRPAIDNIGAIGVMVMADNSGEPGVLVAANSVPYQSPSIATGTIYLSNSSSMPGAGRWLHLPIGASLAAGTYWIAFVSDVDRFDIAYDSGSDHYFTGQYLMSGAYPSAWAITTGSRSYSIRASVI